MHRSSVLGESYGDLGSLQRKDDKQKYLEWVKETISTMKNNQVMFEEGIRDMAATAMRKVQKELKQIMQENMRLIKHVDVQAKLITDLEGEALEMETAADESDFSAPPSPKAVQKYYLSVVLNVHSVRKAMVRAP